MSVLFWEFRKIWRPGVILALVVLSVLFYNGPIKQNIDAFRNVHPSIEEFDLAVELTKESGVTLEEDEVGNLKEKLPALETEAEEWIEKSPVFAEAGIYSLADYRGIDSWSMSTDQKKSEAHGFLASGHCDYVGSRLNALESMIKWYETRSPDAEIYNAFGAVTPAVHKVMEKQSAIYSNTNIMPRYAIEDLGSFSGAVTSWMCLSVIILTAPMALKDSLSGVTELQASSREGRGLYRKQLTATALSAVLLTTIESGIAAAIYSANGTAALWNNPIPMSFLGTSAMVFSLTYGGYVSAIILLAVILMTTVAVLVFVISRKSANAITLTLKLVVIFFFMNHLLKTVFLEPLVLRTRVNLISFAQPIRFFIPIPIGPGEELVITAVLCMVIFILCLLTGFREKRKDF